MTDRTGKSCFSCHKGVYKETTIRDDWDGVLHCDKCGAQVKRWKPGRVKAEGKEAT